MAFYDRRIRRIVPALITVLFFTTIASTAILLPADLIGYGKSLLSSLGFVANIYFWRDTDYFARAAEMKPLLHLWSLGIEEQFYILFPWLIAGLARLRKNFALPVIVLITVISLAIDLTLRSRTSIGPAFYLLPSRAWELGIGAIVALLPVRLRVNAVSAQFMAAVGAVLMLLAIVFPGVAEHFGTAALPATIGTGMIIFAGLSGALPFVNRALELRGLVFFGLISYSLYLWHWPVFVLSRYFLVRDLNTGELVLALIFMVLAAYVSWRFIERPFRRKSMPNVKVRWSAAAGGAFVCLMAVVLLKLDGLPQRLSARAAAINQAVDTTYRCPFAKLMAFGALRACAMNLPSGNADDATVVLLGNSHAQMYTPVVESVLSAHHLHGMLVPLSGCLPITHANLNADCINAAQTNLRSVLRLPHAKTIIIGLTWNNIGGHFVTGTGQDVLNDGNKVLDAELDALLDQLLRSGRHVILIGPIPLPGWDVASDLSRSLVFGRTLNRPLYQTTDEFMSIYGASIKHFSERRDITFVRPDLVQCRNGRCNYVVGDHCLFADKTHFASAEVYRFRDEFERALSEADIR